MALVIGNARYAHIAGLDNVANDAKAMAALFEAARFDSVTVMHDLGADEFRRALRDFAGRAADAEVAALFYAGHGIEVDRVNYLIPVNARLASDLDVEDEAVSLDRVLQLMEPARRLRVVILDACRENPFVKFMKRTAATRSVNRGLGRIEAAGANTLIAFATEPNALAEDGIGLNSPFTAALVRHLATPGLDLRIPLGRVRDDVVASTRSRQKPYVTSSLGGGIIAINPGAPDGSLPAGPSRVEVAQFCQAIATNPSHAVVEALLEANRGTPMATCIEARIAELRKLAISTPPAAKPTQPANSMAPPAPRPTQAPRSVVDSIREAGERTRIKREHVKRRLEELIQEYERRAQEDIPFLGWNALDTVGMMISPLQWYRRHDLIAPNASSSFLSGDNAYKQVQYYYSLDPRTAILALDRAIEELKEANLLNAIQYVTYFESPSSFRRQMLNTQAILDVPPYTGWIPYFVIGVFLYRAGRALARRRTGPSGRSRMDSASAGHHPR